MSGDTGTLPRMSWSFLRSPRWIILSIVVVLIAVLLMNLGFWQLRRLSEREATNARLTANAQAAPTAFADLPGDPDPQAYEYRPVTVTGTYRPDDEVLLRGQSYKGSSGFDVLTPLQTDHGAVLVMRGWVPFALREPTAPDALPPGGRVTVTGYLEPSHAEPPRTGFWSFLSQADPATGTLDRVFHASVPRIAQQVDYSLYPMIVHLTAQTPPQQGRLPRPVPQPPFDNGPHLSYAIQWFSFTAIGVFGYAGVLYRKAKDDAEAAQDAADADDEAAASV